MKCPIDGSDLVMSDRQGIEIDYCPKCRGVWLDRGELDKIIERAAPSTAPAPQATVFAPPPPTRDERPRYDDSDSRDRYRDDRDRGGYERPRKKRESFLGDLFDF